jgi:hypothetical protein
VQTRASYNGSTEASQASDTGPIPVARSTNSLGIKHFQPRPYGKATRPLAFRHRRWSPSIAYAAPAAVTMAAGNFAVSFWAAATSARRRRFAPINATASRAAARPTRRRDVAYGLARRGDARSAKSDVAQSLRSELRHRETPRWDPRQGRSCSRRRWSRHRSPWALLFFGRPHVSLDQIVNRAVYRSWAQAHPDWALHSRQAENSTRVAESARSPAPTRRPRRPASSSSSTGTRS